MIHTPYPPIQFASAAVYMVTVLAAFPANAAEIGRPAIGCDTEFILHDLTRLAALGDAERLQALEDEEVGKGRCVRLAPGQSIELVSSMRAHAPGTHIVYSLALVRVDGRRLFIHRSNLGP